MTEQAGSAPLQRRALDLAALANEAWDVVIVGGGIVGSGSLLRPLVDGRPFLEAEVAWAVRHELALSVDDVLSRRLRLSPELADGGAVVAPRAATILGRELGWGATRRGPEAEAYLTNAMREFAVAPAGAAAAVAEVGGSSAARTTAPR